MALVVTELSDPAEAYEQAHAFLLARPADHNVLLTLLDQSREFPIGGRFWVVRDDAGVVGFATQSPPGMHVGLARMNDPALRALAEAIHMPIPGVIGAAPEAATFAGHFAEHRRVAIEPTEAQRLFELLAPAAIANAPGRLRLATDHDSTALVEWTRAFASETATPPGHADAVVELGVTSERLWVWDHKGPVAMAGASKPAAGVTRIQRVYTPPNRRGAGYATACVEHLSRELTGRGLRCVLYTQMSNPTSNAIYRRIGYQPIAEILRYDCGGGG